MIVQSLAVQRGQWLSFLCCYVICEMEKTICPRPRLKFILNSIKKCACTNETAARNLCNERLGVFCKGLSLNCFFQEFCYETQRLIQKRWESAKKVSFLRSQINPCLFFEVLFKALC